MLHDHDLAFVRPSFLRSRAGTNEKNLTLPERFDARKEWPTCNSIGLIRNQVSCHDFETKNGGILTVHHVANDKKQCSIFSRLSKKVSKYSRFSILFQGHTTLFIGMFIAYAQSQIVMNQNHGLPFSTGCGKD